MATNHLTGTTFAQGTRPRAAPLPPATTGPAIGPGLALDIDDTSCAPPSLPALLSALSRAFDAACSSQTPLDGAVVRDLHRMLPAICRTLLAPPHLHRTPVALTSSIPPASPRGPLHVSSDSPARTRHQRREGERAGYPPLGANVGATCARSTTASHFASASPLLYDVYEHYGALAGARKSRTESPQNTDTLNALESAKSLLSPTGVLMSILLALSDDRNWLYAIDENCIPKPALNEMYAYYKKCSDLGPNGKTSSAPNVPFSQEVEEQQLPLIMRDGRVQFPTASGKWHIKILSMLMQSNKPVWVLNMLEFFIFYLVYSVISAPDSATNACAWIILEYIMFFIPVGDFNYHNIMFRPSITRPNPRASMFFVNMFCELTMRQNCLSTYLSDKTLALKLSNIYSPITINAMTATTSSTYSASVANKTSKCQFSQTVQHQLLNNAGMKCLRLFCNHVCRNELLSLMAAMQSCTSLESRMNHATLLSGSKEKYDKIPPKSTLAPLALTRERFYEFSAFHDSDDHFDNSNSLNIFDFNQNYGEHLFNCDIDDSASTNQFLVLDEFGYYVMGKCTVAQNGARILYAAYRILSLHLLPFLLVSMPYYSSSDRTLASLVRVWMAFITPNKVGNPLTATSLSSIYPTSDMMYLSTSVGKENSRLAYSRERLRDAIMLYVSENYLIVTDGFMAFMDRACTFSLSLQSELYGDETSLIEIALLDFVIKAFIDSAGIVDSAFKTEFLNALNGNSVVPAEILLTTTNRHPADSNDKPLTQVIRKLEELYTNTRDATMKSIASIDDLLFNMSPQVPLSLFIFSRSYCVKFRNLIIPMKRSFQPIEVNLFLGRRVMPETHEQKIPLFHHYSHLPRLLVRKMYHLRARRLQLAHQLAYDSTSLVDPRPRSLRYPGRNMGDLREAAVRFPAQQRFEDETETLENALTAYALLFDIPWNEFSQIAHANAERRNSITRESRNRSNNAQNMYALRDGEAPRDESSRLSLYKRHFDRVAAEKLKAKQDANTLRARIVASSKKRFNDLISWLLPGLKHNTRRIEHLKRRVSAVGRIQLAAGLMRAPPLPHLKPGEGRYVKVGRNDDEYLFEDDVIFSYEFEFLVNLALTIKRKMHIVAAHLDEYRSESFLRTKAVRVACVILRRVSFRFLADSRTLIWLLIILTVYYARSLFDIIIALGIIAFIVSIKKIGMRE